MLVLAIDRLPKGYDFEAVFQHAKLGRGRFYAPFDIPLDAPAQNPVT